MRLGQAWTIARKDLSVLRRKTSLLLGLVAFPLGAALGLPTVIWVVVSRRHVSFVDMIPLINSFLFFFVIAAVVLATSLASYSIVGEKVERSLEPLLATPTTDGEILLGKTLSAFLPTIGAVSVGVAVFAVYIDALSHIQLGYFFFPNGTVTVLLLLVTPLAGLLSVEGNVVISAQMTDVRAAQQVGSLLVLPFAALYVMGEIQAISLDESTLLDIAGILALIDLGLFFLSRATFRREEILTKWK